MDSTAEDARSSKRARLTPSAGEADRISGLDDDVLLRVLELVADARDAVRTGALSRRWLGLWTRVPALRFASRPPLPRVASGDEQCAALERYVSFVNGVLARRAQSNCAIECLAISYTTATTARKREQLMPAAVDGAQEWIRYAFQHGVKSFAVDLLGVPPPNRGYVFQGGFAVDLPLRDEDHHHGDDEDEDHSPLVIIDEELPSPERLETMHLALGNARLRLPTTMKFTSLMDLSLERMKIAPGGAQLLARLVSPTNCPRLQKLRMSKLCFPPSDEEVLLDADVLSDIWVEDVDMRSLELRTPSLRVLHIDTCCGELLRVLAPRLEELTFFQQGYPLSRLEVDGDLAHVRSLKYFLRTHHHPSYPSETEKDTNVLLLKHCSSVTCLDVTLDGRKVFKKEMDMIEGSVPHLPHVTSLTVNLSNLFDRHEFGASVASLLTRFKNLRHLSLHLPSFPNLLRSLREGLDLECDHPDYWTSHEISMAHLQVVELTQLTGTNCELQFMKVVLASAKTLRKVAISFNKRCGQHPGKMDAFERMLLDEGGWTSYRDALMLTCHAWTCKM